MQQGNSVPVMVAAPPSKSLSHCKLVAASLARGTTQLKQVMECDDIFRTMDVLSRVGAVMERTAPGEYTVTGIGGPPNGGYETAAFCFMGESEASCRLLTSVLAAGNGAFLIDGARRLRKRSLDDLMAALSVLGANISYISTLGELPLTIATHGLAQVGKDSWLPVRGDISSQFMSGLLLAAPMARGGLGLLLAGEISVPWSYIGLTLQTLEESGCHCSVATLREGSWVETDWRTLRIAHPGATRLRVKAGTYHPLKGSRAVVEGDYSDAACFLAAGAAGLIPVTVGNLNRDSLQGDRAILEILTAMGTTVAWDADRVTVSPALLRGIDHFMGDCPDLVMPVAVLASMAIGHSILRGIRHLGFKESDRCNSLAVELDKIGCRVEIGEEAMTIIPARATPGGTFRFSAHNDHRLAMSLALLELTGLGVELDDPSCVGKSFPEFWKLWRKVNPGTRIGGV